MDNTSILSQNVTKTPTICCNFCNVTFKYRSSLLTHYKKTHPNFSPPPSCKSQTKKSNAGNKPFTCTICKLIFSKLEDVVVHFKSLHEVDFETESLEFDSFESFTKWRESVETNRPTKARFVKFRGSRKNKNLSERSYYGCCRSGYFKSKGKGIRNLKTQGSRKINGSCPAGITVVKNRSGRCDVLFFKTHIGHDVEIAHLTLMDEDRAFLASKISSKVPFEEILNELRESLLQETSLDRPHLISRKDLHNIEQSFNLNNQGVRHKNDWVSVQSWVDEMKGEENSCVLMYKPQGEKHETLKEEDFFLAIMNEAQGDMLQKFGGDVVCVDGTHGLNQYNFELITLLTLDDMHQGFPCAFLFCNRTDQGALEVFFKLIKAKVGEIRPRVFMSDMAESFFNAWQAIMSKPAFRLFCTWHVIKAWKINIKEKVKINEKQTDVLKKIVTLLEETDISAFQEMSSNLHLSLMMDPDTMDFGKYFEKTYLKCAESWAFCYRKFSTVNTNMHIESIHKIIKYFYFHGKQVKRLDKAIHSILAFVRDKVFDRLILLNKGKVTSKVKHLRNKHKLSTSLKVESVVEDEDHWIVPSSTSKELYKVTKVEVNCKCQLLCTYCNVCIHQYRCTCIDNSIKWNMCKHIHLVCRFKTESSTTYNSPKASIDSVVENLFCIGNETNEIEQNLDQEKAKLLQYVEGLISSASSTDELNIIKNALKPIKPTMDALKLNKLTLSQDEITHQKSTIPANKNINKQRFFSTKKKTNKPKRSFVKPSREEKDKIALALLMGEHAIKPTTPELKVMVQHDHNYHLL